MSDMVYGPGNWQMGQIGQLTGYTPHETATTLLAKLKVRRDEIQVQLASVERLKAELEQLKAMIKASEGT